MLNAETKKIINSARDVLVGKIPDPKAQVEQITFAMFYKFMDEKDNEAVALGGKRQFFTGEFENFSWSKLMDPRLGGTERMDLYTQALAKMSQNPHIAQLFRDIYKDAFIPFRSPETLSLFLKEIDQLDYTNTESLGDAFEYLLSVMGSQGDAGQFRTPRHIIDFIVNVVDPQKSDTILDPACGTAGFLISSYKHIVKQHDGKDDPENKETPLTPDEKKDLMRNLMGYDISPDMVRLSKVNLYLHGLPNPTIYEYDTLSSEEKWDENFDVILANPPFMSPKGGIRPHKRFSIQVNRSEVLFVDYILEHLKPKGKAGVIVPEGIIFQTGSAYLDLRKQLLEKGVWAVISLPVGVFSPYTKTTKTSILFIDKNTQSKNNSVMFIKIESDGFDLGAERLPILENDLLPAIELLNQSKSLIKLPKTKLNFKIVTLDDLKKRHEINFAVFNDAEDQSNTNYTNVKIGQILKQVKIMEKLNDNQQYNQITVRMNGKGVVLRKQILGSQIKTKTQFVASTGDFIISKIDARNGAFGIVPPELDKAVVTSDFPLFQVDTKIIIPDFLNIMIQSPQFIKICQLTSVGTSNRKRIKLSKFLDSRIPLPNIDEQKKFLLNIDIYNKEIYDLDIQIKKLNMLVKLEIEKVWKI